jgi:hypothetical protein
MSYPRLPWVTEFCPRSRTIKHLKHFADFKHCPLCNELNPRFNSESYTSPLTQQPEVIDITSSPPQPLPARMTSQTIIRTQANPTTLAFANQKVVTAERTGTFTSRTQTSAGKASALIQTFQISIKVCVRLLDTDEDGFPIPGEPRIVGKLYFLFITYIY